MLFIGHFSFDEIDSDNNQRHGYFSIVVDAPSADEAIAKFEAHINQTKDTIPAMTTIANVYIEEILKFSQLYHEPIITRLQSSEGAFPKSISYSLPGVFDKEVEAFGYGPDVENHEMLNDNSYIASKPFISYKR